MSIPELLKAQQIEFEKKFSSRLGNLELFYQNHGGEPFVGENIPQFLSSSTLKVLTSLLSELEKEYVDAVDKIINGGIDNRKGEARARAEGILEGMRISKDFLLSIAARHREALENYERT